MKTTREKKDAVLERRRRLRGNKEAAAFRAALLQFHAATLKYYTSGVASDYDAVCRYRRRLLRMYEDKLLALMAPKG